MDEKLVGLLWGAASALVLTPVLSVAFSRYRRAALPRQEQSDERLERILDAVEEGVILADPSGRVLFVNQAAPRLLATSAPSLLGVRFAERYDGFAPSRLLELLAGDVDVRENLRIPQLDRTLRVRTTQVLRRDGSMLGRLAVLTDISGDTRTERLRREFVSNASHELRTPVAALAAALETLETEMDEPQVREEFLQRALVEAQNLQRLTNGLLDLSLAEDAAAPAAERTDVADVVRSIVLSMQPLARPKEQVLNAAVQADLYAAIPSMDLGRILRNLVDNAVKYTQAGGHIQVQAQRTNSSVQVTVTDDGPGIPAAQMARIFERFFRLDRSRTGSSGAGLGLSIARHLAERSGGSLSVANAAEGGAAFTLTLPGVE